ncbi:retron Ec67 family RNA-directed DNA polymerase/endonuclease [Burkholderia ubonensis]|uniref:retron Ec67 family RNA-directed DNA polymerase/endonuclease n=1 Tax=Burkholderia ubonensis TaxID=101571 RepID=UPI0009B3400E|nr:retron Ec67 family RNA-directed DNA polymerase/endonuclease [Burkholderia ubonensis]
MSSEKSILQLFQAASSRSDVAALLDIKLKDLTYLLYVMKDHDKYKTFDIAKRSGGKRQISAPIKNVKSLQRKLADRLEQCLTLIESAAGRKNPSSHGFRRGKSILTNAATHRNRRYVFNVDLEDFFPSITGQRIRGLLIKDKKFGFHKDVATTIAHIACHNGKLPQGSPCSPVISNMVAAILDFHLSRLARDNGCVYTRYADDITFSTNQKEFPIAIAVRKESNGHVWEASNQLQGLIKKSGFSINVGKTRMQYKTSRQQVTGLVVNKKVNVTTEYRRLVRAYVFSLINRNGFTVKKSRRTELGDEIVSVDGTREQLHGMLSFVHSVDSVFRTNVKQHPQNYPGMQADAKKPTGTLDLYRRFLFFTRFFSNTLPLIVCEGKTDNVYLSNAVHQSKVEFPRLITKGNNGPDVLAFHFLKYARKHKRKKHIYLPNFSTVQILGAGSGGGPNLGGLILNYHAEYTKFRAPKGKFPVIFIVDNDSGGKAVFNKVKHIAKVSGHEPFVRLFGNLYIVPVPLVGAAEKSIEELFAPADLAKGMDGRSFDFSKDSSDATSIGKAGFAYDFVAKQAKDLDWSGFHPLLQNICAALNDYDALSATL